MRPRPRIAFAFFVLGLALAGAVASCSNDPSGPTMDCAPYGKVECQVDCQKPYPWSGSKCESYCVDISSDSENCGHCGVICAAPDACVGGRCSVVCGDGDSLCATDSDGGTRRCVNTTSDDHNCGGCGAECNPGWFCHDSKCVVTCGGTAQGQTLCALDGGPPYCASLPSDNANCGKCGTVCGPNDECYLGICAPFGCTVDQSYCNTDAGPRYCANVGTDNANCGKCGVQCGVLQSCEQGRCVPACNGYQKKCVGDGGVPFCVDAMTDNTNCGSCGNTCPSAKPMCAGGVCNDGSCGTTALVLGDGNASSNAAYQTLLQSVGYTVTLLPTGANGYSGSPAASRFSIVIVSPGKTYWVDMPAAGQSAITSAQAGGTGLIFTEWSSYFEVGVYGFYQTLAPLLLYPKGTLLNATVTFSLTSSGHPIWTGLPTTFTTTVGVGTNVTSGLNAQATQIASCTQCGGAGVAVQDPSGAGRVVQINHAAGYSAWYSDTNLTKMMANAALWASHCY